MYSTQKHELTICHKEDFLGHIEFINEKENHFFLLFFLVGCFFSLTEEVILLK